MLMRRVSGEWLSWSEITEKLLTQVTTTYNCREQKYVAACTTRGTTWMDYNSRRLHWVPHWLSL